MSCRRSFADLFSPEEAAHLAVAVREYRRRRVFAVPHSFADIESELAQRAMGSPDTSAPDWSRQHPTISASDRQNVDSEPMTTTDLLTIEQTARRLQLSARSVERRIAAGDLPVIRSGRSVRVRQEDLDAYLAAGGAA